MSLGIGCDLFDKVLIERMDAAFALNHFHHDGADLIRFAQVFNVVKIVGFGIDETVDEGTEILMK